MTTLIRSGKAANQAECDDKTNPGGDHFVLCIQSGLPFVICLLNTLESVLFVLKPTLVIQLRWFYYLVSPNGWPFWTPS